MLRLFRPFHTGLFPSPFSFTLPHSFLLFDLILFFQLVFGLELVLILQLFLRLQLITVAIPVLSALGTAITSTLAPGASAAPTA